MTVPFSLTSENNRLAEWSFAYGIVVDKIHTQLYNKMLENFDKLQNKKFIWIFR
jgi:hypothetical protein